MLIITDCPTSTPYSFGGTWVPPVRPVDAYGRPESKTLEGRPDPTTLNVGDLVHTSPRLEKNGFPILYSTSLFNYSHFLPWQNSPPPLGRRLFPSNRSMHEVGKTTKKGRKERGKKGIRNKSLTKRMCKKRIGKRKVQIYTPPPPSLGLIDL